MRIAQVTLRFDAPGGVESCVRAVSRGLARAGDSVTVYASDLYDESGWDRRSDWAPLVDGIPIRRFPVTKRLVPGLTLPLMSGLVDALREDRPDLLHAHSHRYGHLLQCTAVARQLRIPLVVSTHYHPADAREPSGKRMLLRAQDHLFGMSAYHEAAALIVESAMERRRVSEFAPASKIEKIPPGIELSAWADASQDRPPAGMPERYLLFAGRLAPNKGLPTLLRAYARLPASTRPALVLMGGDWGTRAVLEALAGSLGIRESVRFLGHIVDPGQYRAVFRGASVFVLPSEYEAFGLVLLEAMAAGAPIIASAVGATPEVLQFGKSGRLTHYGDPEGLAQAMTELLGDPTVAGRYREEARKQVGSFDWSVAVAHHRTLYERLAG